MQMNDSDNTTTTAHESPPSTKSLETPPPPPPRTPLLQSDTDDSDDGYYDGDSSLSSSSSSDASQHQPQQQEGEPQQEQQQQQQETKPAARTVERGRITVAVSPIRNKPTGSRSPSPSRPSSSGISNKTSSKRNKFRLQRLRRRRSSEDSSGEYSTTSSEGAPSNGGKWIVRHSRSSPGGGGGVPSGSAETNTPPSTSPQWNVPRYGSTNRMLMPSPLPSPEREPRKRLSIRSSSRRSNGHNSNRYDSDSSSSSDSDESVREARRKKREEDRLARLVIMAKQQQSFAAAWFAAAASAGGGIPISTSPRTTTPSSVLGPRRPQKSIASGAGSGAVVPSSRTVTFGRKSTDNVRSSSTPIDIDSGEEWSGDEEEGIEVEYGQVIRDDNLSPNRDNDDDSSCSSISSAASHVSKKMKKVVGSIVQRGDGGNGGGATHARRTSDDGSFAAATASTAHSTPSRTRLRTSTSRKTGSSESAHLFLRGGAQLDLETGSVLRGSDGGGDDDSSSGRSIIVRPEEFDSNGAKKVPDDWTIPCLPYGRRQKVSVSCVLVAIIALCIVGAATFIGIYVSGNQNNDDGSPPVGSSGSAHDANFESEVLTLMPSLMPTGPPSSAPPTLSPTVSLMPSASPTTVSPTQSPTEVPTNVPSTVSPTQSPTEVPTDVPSTAPTVAPSPVPSSSPTISQAPSSFPTDSPTSVFAITIFDPIGSTLLGSQPKDQHGHSIALSNDGMIVAIGSRYSSANGTRSGEVRVYRLANATLNDTQTTSEGGSGGSTRDLSSYSFAGLDWVPMGQTLRGRNAMDQFGFSIDLSSDGMRLAASEPGFDGPAGDRSGNVRVFDYDPSSDVWIQIGNDIAGETSTDLFGVSVDLSGDGKRLAVGAPYHDYAGRLSGRVRVFEVHEGNETAWAALGQPLNGTATNDWLGWDISMSDSGEDIAIGAPRNADGGYVRVFHLSGVGSDPQWAQVGPDIVCDNGEAQTDDRFGMAVSMSADGERVAIGAPWKDADAQLQNSGLAAVFQRKETAGETTWEQLGSNIVGQGLNDQLGWALALSASGEYLVVGTPGYNSNTGEVRVYRWDGFTWEGAKPFYGDMTKDDFGFSVSIADEGGVLGVGAPVINGLNSDGRGYGRVYASEEL